MVSIIIGFDLTDVYVDFTESIDSRFFLLVAKQWRSVQANRSVNPDGVFGERARARGRRSDDRRDEKSCRWVQIDDVNGPPASRGGWLVEVKCECVHGRREADRDEEKWRRKEEYN